MSPFSSSPYAKLWDTVELSLKGMPIAIKGMFVLPLMKLPSPLVSCFICHLYNIRGISRSLRESAHLATCACSPHSGLACTLLGKYSLSLPVYLLFSQLGCAPLGDFMIRRGNCGQMLGAGVYTQDGGGWGRETRPTHDHNCPGRTWLDSEAELIPLVVTSRGPALRGGFYRLLLFGNELRFL